MKAFLIDPNARKITAVEYNGSLDDIRKQIDAGTVDVARFDDAGNVVYLDDEGLYSKGPVYQFFGVKGFPNPIPGKGLVVGTNLESGESADAGVTLEWLKANVFWIEVLMNGVMGVTRYGKRKADLVRIERLPEVLGDYWDAA